MATRRTLPSPPLRHLTPDEMRAAIPKLERRIRDLEEFDPKSIRDRDDPRIDALDKKVETPISEVLEGTSDYNRFMPRGLDQAGYNMVYATPLQRVIESVQDSVAREVANMRTIIEVFNERLGDGGESPAARAKRAFSDLDLEPSIAGACAKLFEDGHYAESVETACKVLDNLVQIRSGRFDETGVPLMQVVFSQKNPILRFNDQANDSERSEQLGMMWLYSGAMAALRNPRAHGVVRDDPEQALEYISFVSMLAKGLGRTKR